MSQRPLDPLSYGSVDGTLRPLDELMVPATDRGLLLGDAVFETLRTYDGSLFALQQHLDRLHDGMDAIHLRDAPGREAIADWTRQATRASLQAQRDAGNVHGDPACVVRVTITRGHGGHGISPRGAGPPRVIVIARPLPPPDEAIYAKGLSVVTARVKRAPVGVQDPKIKATSALNLILARLEADSAGADEALLTDLDGRYLEASAANLFALNDGAYWTPQGEDGVLEGVTADIVKRILDDAGWQARHGPIPREVLDQADEVLLTQTTREVLPVVRVDGRPVGDGRPGDVASHLRESMHELRHRLLDP